MKNFISILFITILSTSCVKTTTLKDIPTNDSDFNYSLIHLKSKYSDINEYDIERDFKWGEERKFPLLSDLEKTWGNPKKLENKWALYAGNTAVTYALYAADYFSSGLFGVFLIMNGPPDGVYEWVKGNIRIKAHVGYSGYSNYDPYIYSWEWSENTKTAHNKLINTDSPDVRPINQAARSPAGY